MTTEPASGAPSEFGQSGRAHRQTIRSAPAKTAPIASARRCPTVRGSASQTARAIAVSRRSISSACVVNSRPHTDRVPPSSSGLPNCTSIPRAASPNHSRACGSWASTARSMSVSTLWSDNGPHCPAAAAISASMAAISAAPTTQCVRHEIVAASRAPICPARNSSLTLGSRSRSDCARYICDDARRALIPSAAATSAAAASQGSQAHRERSSTRSGSVSTTPQRRATSSPIAASRRAAAAASPPAQPSIAPTTPASFAAGNASGPIPSNILSILGSTGDTFTVTSQDIGDRDAFNQKNQRPRLMMARSLPSRVPISRSAPRPGGR